MSWRTLLGATQTPAVGPGRDRTLNVQLGGAVTLNVRGRIELVLPQPPDPEPPKPTPNPITALVTSRFPGGFSVKGAGNVAYNMPVQTHVGVEVAYVDKGGNPAQVDGEVEWTSSNSGIVSVSKQGGMAADIMAGSVLGTAQITATADADMGEGVRQILTLLDVTVVAGEAVAGTISPTGAPEPITVGRRA